MKSFFAPALCGLSVLLAAPAFADATQDCHVASYRLADGTAVDVAPSDGETLRWRLWDGETGLLHKQTDGTWASTLGWTGKSDGKAVSFSDCATGKITFGKQYGQRIAFDTTETTFDSNGVKLAGRLVMPKGDGKVPVVVLTHGSEHDSALQFYFCSACFPPKALAYSCSTSAAPVRPAVPTRRTSTRSRMTMLMR
jgi:hypothetical protein